MPHIRIPFPQLKKLLVLINGMAHVLEWLQELLDGGGAAGCATRTIPALEPLRVYFGVGKNVRVIL